MGYFPRSAKNNGLINKTIIPGIKSTTTYKNKIKKWRTTAPTLAAMGFWDQNFVQYGYDFALAAKTSASKNPNFSLENVAQYYQGRGPLWDAGLKSTNFDNFNPPVKEKKGLEAFASGVRTMIKEDPLKAVAIVGAVVVTAGAASTAVAGLAASAGTVTATTTATSLAAGIEAAKKVKESVDKVKSVQEKMSNLSDNIKNAAKPPPQMLAVKSPPPANQKPQIVQEKEKSADEQAGLAVAAVIGAKFLL